MYIHVAATWQLVESVLDFDTRDLCFNFLTKFSKSPVWNQLLTSTNLVVWSDPSPVIKLSRGKTSMWPLTEPCFCLLVWETISGPTEQRGVQMNHRQDLIWISIISQRRQSGRRSLEPTTVPGKKRFSDNSTIQEDKISPLWIKEPNTRYLCQCQGQMVSLFSVVFRREQIWPRQSAAPGLQTLSRLNIWDIFLSSWAGDWFRNFRVRGVYSTSAPAPALISKTSSSPRLHLLLLRVRLVFFILSVTSVTC